MVREALASPASTEYLDTLEAELGLQPQDLADLVQVFRAAARCTLTADR